MTHACILTAIALQWYNNVLTQVFNMTTIILTDRLNILDLVHQPKVWNSEHLNLRQNFLVYE